jgi:radical SAM superfamily enzyme YgiQ (UPF0313 family)
MRILLVNPPRSPHNAILDHATDASRPFIHRKLVGPPLGLLTVATAVRHHDVRLLEMKAEYDLRPQAPEPQELLRQHLEAFQPDLVGVTLIASEVPAGLELLRTAKRWNPEVVTVAGGLHVTLCPADLDQPWIDILCPGSSALTFRTLADTLARGGKAASVPGLLVREDGHLRPTPPVAVGGNPATTEFLVPDRSLLRPWLPAYVVGKTNGPGTYLFTSLGCPHRCSFCSIWPQYNGAYLQREIESVIAELKTLDEYIAVRFADANSIIDTTFIDRLFTRIEEEGIRKIFIMDIRADTLAHHPRLLEKLAANGLKVVICGFESFRQEELQRYDKALQVEEISAAVKVCSANGIMLRGNHIIPPDYGRDDFAALAEFAAANPVELAGYTLLTPMPGTALHARSQDQISDRDLAKYNMFNSVLRTKLPLDEFYARTAALWAVRRGTRVL